MDTTCPRQRKIAILLCGAAGIDAAHAFTARGVVAIVCDLAAGQDDARQRLGAEQTHNFCLRTDRRVTTSTAATSGSALSPDRPRTRGCRSGRPDLQRRSEGPPPPSRSDASAFVSPAPGSSLRDGWGLSRSSSWRRDPRCFMVRAVTVKPNEEIDEILDAGLPR